MRNLILIGGGGHCRSVIDVVLEEKKYSLLGVIDRDPQQKEVFGFPFLGTDEAIEGFAQKGISFLVSIGKLSHEKGPRENIILYLEKIKAQFATIVSPRAHVSRFANIQEGSVIFHGSIVNAGATVGRNCILNSNSLLEHDACLGSGSHLSTGATVNGGSVIAEGSFLGSGSVVAHGLKCHSPLSLGALSFLNQGVSEPGLYVGSPAKKKRG